MGPLVNGITKQYNRLESSASPDTQQPASSQVFGGSIHFTSTRVQTLDQEHLKKNRVLTQESAAGVSQAYKLLRTQVLQKLTQHHWHSLAIISARRGDGSTLTAINLAISLAMHVRYSTLLADFNLINPSIHHVLGLQPEYGLGDYLQGEAYLPSLLINPGIERLVVLPGKEQPGKEQPGKELPGKELLTGTSELLSSPHTLELTRELNTRYANRIVIYDLPPLLDSDDTMAFLPQFDACLLVINEGKTKREDVLQMAELLQDKPVLGTVLNNALSQ